MNYKKSEWFVSNKLSINVKKKNNLFYMIYDNPLVLSKLNINNRRIVSTESIKFIGVLLSC